MDDIELFAKLLRIAPPWRVTRVSVDVAAARVEVGVEEIPDAQFPCAVGPAPAPVDDHTPAPAWRHLDPCERQTYVHARLPRTACRVDGVKQLRAPWAEARSESTSPFETRIIDTCQECEVTGVRRLRRTGGVAPGGVRERSVARGRARKPRRVPARLGVPICVMRPACPVTTTHWGYPHSSRKRHNN